MNYKALALDALDVGTNASNRDVANHHLARAQVYALLALVEQGEPVEITQHVSLADSLSIEQLRAELSR